MTLSSGEIILALIFLGLWTFLAPLFIWVVARAWILDQLEVIETRFADRCVSLVKQVNEAVTFSLTQDLPRMVDAYLAKHCGLKR